MAKYFHHFLPLSPPVPQEELEEIQCLREIRYETKAGDALMIRLLGRQHSIDVIAITIPDSAPTDKRDKWIEQIGNHMLAILRVTYDASADVVRNGDGFINLCTETDNPQPDYKVVITSQVNKNYAVNTKNVAAIFCETMSSTQATILSLLAEAQIPSVPTHYKILSLIRALEILFPSEQERFAWLDRYEDKFAALKISNKRFRNALPELRTRCAHGVSRGDVVPLVGQAYGEVREILLLLKLLRQVVADRANEIYGLGLYIGSPPTARSNQ